MSEDLRMALRAIDRVLTTEDGDNVPRGEAPKLLARSIARDALGTEATSWICKCNGRTRVNPAGRVFCTECGTRQR